MVVSRVIPLPPDSPFLNLVCQTYIIMTLLECRASPHLPKTLPFHKSRLPWGYSPHPCPSIWLPHLQPPLLTQASAILNVTHFPPA